MLFRKNENQILTYFWLTKTYWYELLWTLYYILFLLDKRHIFTTVGNKYVSLILSSYPCVLSNGEQLLFLLHSSLQISSEVLVVSFKSI